MDGTPIVELTVERAAEVVHLCRRALDLPEERSTPRTGQPAHSLR
ncbi:hypothetical protein [Micromonospora craniellae]|nr:hypothetical protein [Micromonospora craniellae]